MRFVYDGTDLTLEYDAAGNVVRRQVHGSGEDEPLVTYEGSGTGVNADRRYLHSDERGSIIALSPGTGIVANFQRYDEYGVPAATNTGRFQYTGQVWINELKLHNFKARWYWADGGRFLQPSAFNDATPQTALDTAGSFNALDYEQYGYDANGNRTSLRTRAAETLNFTYDNLNRMTGQGGRGALTLLGG